MNLDTKDLAIIETEEQLLSTILASLEQQKQKHFNRKIQQSKLSQELNSEIVNTLRVEEKLQIYSSEAVAYELAQMSKESIEIIDQQLDSPYFARLELDEETPSGTIKKIEYKIGKNANPDCRVIDWRKAPIAKLYYDYSEGDSYYEIIQGQERQGEVKLKNSFEITSGELNTITTSTGKFQKNNKTWKKFSGSSAPRSSYGQLPDILALITSEQFSSITSDPELPVIIQGVAGSGKTIVAIHRLSWLLHEDNSKLDVKDVVFTVKSHTLLQYIKNSLLEVKLEAVPLVSFQDLLSLILKKLGSNLTFSKEQFPISHRRLLYSTALRNYAFEFLHKNPSLAINSVEDAINHLTNLLSNYSRIIELDTSRLIDKQLIVDTKEKLLKSINENFIDMEFALCALNIWQQKSPSKFKGLFKHLIIDEIQDYTRIELELLLNCLESKNQVTLLGDLNQDLNLEVGFPGWEFLKKEIGTSELIQLKISHRSTLQIIRLAQEISKQNYSEAGRSGQLPIWFGCRSEDSALKACIKWLKTAQDKYPTSLTAVVCATMQEAKLLYSLLEPSFSSSIRLLDTDLNLSAGIVITDVSKTKGLEFYNVLVWNTSLTNYPNDSYHQKLLYVAVTRAEENLSFISWGKATEFLKNIPESMIRRFKYEG